LKIDLNFNINKQNCLVVLYKPVLLKDLKNKIDSLLLLSRQEEVNDNKLAMMIL